MCKAIRSNGIRISWVFYCQDNCFYSYWLRDETVIGLVSLTFLLIREGGHLFTIESKDNINNVI